jgi:hypothetical protein
MTGPPVAPTPLPTPSESEAEGFYKVYEEHAKALRTWLVAYGVGGPVLFLTNPIAQERLAKSGQPALSRCSFSPVLRFRSCSQRSIRRSCGAATTASFIRHFESGAGIALLHGSPNSSGSIFLWTWSR